MHLGDLRGKARVVVMHYTSCAYACPLLISQVKNIANALPAVAKDNVGFVAVTFNPERDTPHVLQAYGDKMHLDPRSWTLLHGAPDDVLELAVLLGVKYKKDNQGGFSHSNLMTVLNKKGEIVYRHVGLYHPITETIAAISRAAHE
jgi:protein SCO1/2